LSTAAVHDGCSYILRVVAFDMQLERALDKIVVSNGLVQKKHKLHFALCPNRRKNHHPVISINGVLFKHCRRPPPYLKRVQFWGRHDHLVVMQHMIVSLACARYAYSDAANVLITPRRRSRQSKNTKGKVQRRSGQELRQQGPSVHPDRLFQQKFSP
jgi:hypothetical protein